MDGFTKQKVSVIIKRYRGEKGITQQELANLTGLSLRSIQRIEKGEVQPREYTLRLFVEKLGITNEYVEVSDDSNASEGGLNTSQKIIITILSPVILFLILAGYLAQSPVFPETHFEFFALLLTLVVAYACILMKLWKTR
jgi:transcriptional regulator with XRE-family HTH domain